MAEAAGGGGGSRGLRAGGGAGPERTGLPAAFLQPWREDRMSQALGCPSAVLVSAQLILTTRL